MPAPPKARSQRQQVKEWLSEQLADGDWHRPADIEDEATQSGLSRRTLYRVAAALQVERERQGMPAIAYWRLPGGSGTGTSGKSGTTGEEEEVSSYFPSRATLASRATPPSSATPVSWEDDDDPYLTM